MWGRSEKGGGGVEKVRGGETTEGRCAGARARVNDATLSARRLQPCLSEQQCCRVEHGSQLAGAWRGLAGPGALMFPASCSS